MVHQQLMEAYDFSESELDDILQPKSSRSHHQINIKKFESAENWKDEINILFDALWHCEDSFPFRYPIDNVKYPGMHKLFLLGIFIKVNMIVSAPNLKDWFPNID